VERSISLDKISVFLVVQGTKVFLGPADRVFQFHESARRNRLTRPLVDWTARQIHDPVWRLRYLRSVAPSACSSRWKSRKTIGLLTLLGFGLVIAPLSLRMLGAANAAVPTLPARVVPPPAPPIQPVEPAAAPSAEVWQVEKASDFEIYSNGLRIENQYAVSHRPRTYRAFSRDP
jgi:hypothetical protein